MKFIVEIAFPHEPVGFGDPALTFFFGGPRSSVQPFRRVRGKARRRCMPLLRFCIQTVKAEAKRREDVNKWKRLWSAKQRLAPT